MNPPKFIKQMLDVGTNNQATRDAWIAGELKKIPAGHRILDAGAGEQRFKPMCAHLQYVAQDFAQYDGTGDQKGLQTGTWDQTTLDLVCDIANIPEPDGAFDAVLCIEVFEHLPNPVLAIKELARVLRPGGQLILTAPFISLTHFAPYHFSTGFSRYYYESHLPSFGLDIVEIVPNGNYFEVVAQEVRRVRTIAGQYARERVRPWEYLAIAGMLRLLRRLSQRDTGSSELLNYGFLVRAVRR